MERKYSILVTVILVLVVLLQVGCEFEKPDRLTQVTDEQSAFVSVFKVDYEEESATFSFRRPRTKIYAGSLGKAANENSMYMVDYNNIHKHIEFDEDGYMATSTDYIEGSENGPLLSGIESELDQLRPASDPDKKIVTSVELRNGNLIFLDESSEVLRSKQLNQEEFRIDIAVLDSMNFVECDTCMGKVNSSIAELRENQMSFNMVDNFHAKIESASDSQHLSKITRVVDLRTGLVKKTATYDAEGRPRALRNIRHEIVEGFPVESGSLTYRFGSVNNSWQAISMKVVNRTNISVERRSL